MIILKETGLSALERGVYVTVRIPITRYLNFRPFLRLLPSSGAYQKAGRQQNQWQR